MFLGFLYLSCEESNEPEILWDPAFFVDGMVLDSITQAPISEVLVCFRTQEKPDSLYFVGDSVIANAPLWGISETKAEGKFHIELWMTYKDSNYYQLMFAWKTGYKLWRYDHHPVYVKWIDDVRDEVTIYLSKK